MSTARHLEDLAEELSTRKAAGERTLKVWGHRRGLTLPDVRSLARQLVAQGRLVEGEGPGGLVWRPTERRTLDLPPLEIETGEPAAPLVCSVCSKEYGAASPCAFCTPLGHDLEPSPTPPPASVERAIEEEPVAVAGAAEPCQGCAGLNATVARWEREWGSHGIERMVLQSEIASLRQERDEARHSLATSAAEYDRLLSHLRDRLAIEEPASVDYIVGAVGLLVDGADARRRAPAVDPGAIAHYLLELPADRWEALATARSQLAQAREMAHAAQLLEASALATVDQILSAPAGEAPAVEAVEEPEPPPSGEQPAGESDEPAEPDPASVIGRVLRWLRKRPDARARQVAEALSLSVPHANAALVTLARRGLAERVELGLYRAVRAKEAA